MEAKVTEPIDLNQLDVLWAASTQGEWLTEGSTVYTLVHYGWRKGVELFQNRLWFSVNLQCNADGSGAERIATAKYIAALHNQWPALRDELLAARKRIVELEKIESDLTTKGAMQFEAFDDFLLFIEQTMNTVVAAQNGVIKGPELAPGVAALRAKIYSAGPGWLAARDARMKVEGAAEVWRIVAERSRMVYDESGEKYAEAEAERLRGTK